MHLEVGPGVLTVSAGIYSSDEGNVIYVSEDAPISKATGMAVLMWYSLGQAAKISWKNQCAGLKGKPTAGLREPLLP